MALGGAMNASLPDTDFGAASAMSNLLSDPRFVYIALINSPIAIILSYILWQFVSNVALLF